MTFIHSKTTIELNGHYIEVNGHHHRTVISTNVIPLGNLTINYNDSEGNFITATLQLAIIGVASEVRFIKLR